MKNLVLTEGELIRSKNQMLRIPFTVMVLVALIEGACALFGLNVDNNFPPILNQWYLDYEGGAFFEVVLAMAFNVRPLFDIFGAYLLSYLIVYGSWSLTKSKLIKVKEIVFMSPAAYLMGFLVAHLLNDLPNEAGIYVWMSGLALSILFCLIIDRQEKFIYIYNTAIVWFVIMIFKGFIPAAVFTFPFIVGVGVIFLLRLIPPIRKETIKKFLAGENL